MRNRGGPRLRGARAVVIVAMLAVFGLTSVGVSGASAAEADTIATLVNQARAGAGLPALIHNPAMDSVALQWARQMAAANALSHNPSYASQIPGGWTRAGENVAMGQPTPTAMQQAWMNSAGHRANILGDFTDIGIAFITVNGTTWGVQDFGKYAGHAVVAAPAAPAPIVQSAPTATRPTLSPSTAAPAAAPAAPAAAPPSALAPSSNPRRTPRSAPDHTPAPDHMPAPEPQDYSLSVSKSSAGVFPIGYIVGGVLMLLGLGGGVYGQMLRRRGRRPPGS